MKRSLFTFLLDILLVLPAISPLGAQQLLRGQVLDEQGRPLPDVNLFIKETLEGTASDAEGRFSLSTSVADTFTLCARMLGYEPYRYAGRVDSFPPLLIRMRPLHFALDNVEIVAGNFLLKGSSQWKNMQAVDLVTTGGSAGDLYRSIETLPGTQVVGEDGRLFIRGGDSREAQTYIDGLHVQNPYTTTGGRAPVRGRYSPFMFEGINFSLGGYDPEYAQGLSSVLPLSTKDESPVSKYGVHLSSVGAGGGGTKAYGSGSASVDLNYENMAPYFSLIPDRTDWIRPYRHFSGGMQVRHKPGSRTLWKGYAGYDGTSLSFREPDRRKLALKEHTFYLNTTFRHETAAGLKWYAGAAFSLADQRVTGASRAGDSFRKRDRELHLKIKAEKRFSSFFKGMAGTEILWRGHRQRYRSGTELSGILYENGIGPTVNGLFANALFYFSPRLNAVLSSRLEYTSPNRQWNYMPRVAVNYDLAGFQFSAIAGRYSQLASDDYLLRDASLLSESCWHFILGSYYRVRGRLFRFETYYKRYDRLVCETDGRPDGSGDGYSKGIDLYFEDISSIPRLEYRCSYSLNRSERKYRDFPVRDVPPYASRHNASVALRYRLTSLRSILGLTDRFASGRPYHDPNAPGFMNARTPAYNSLDVSLTVLVHPKVIVYASASNLLCRKEVYNYTWDVAPDGRYRATPVRANVDHFFYIGVFITLGGNTAYDVSNF